MTVLIQNMDREVWIQVNHLYRYRKGRSRERRFRRDILSLNARLLQCLCFADMGNCHPKVCKPVREGFKRQRATPSSKSKGHFKGVLLDASKLSVC